ncbi:hypothetical protein [Natrinema sp. 1APR25-10V2]|uniref:hypothetical protein n=1 Tax=Natrinema sp. 1APR25-10V2 TaxID=2951081 RepID=UPI002876F9C9|nr:hypothetical protein [Natrinema sp. 1APR25-10V2]MDS0473784.1 hypothetical protein [Natrinema sp. 1APR25-10V2]
MPTKIRTNPCDHEISIETDNVSTPFSLEFNENERAVAVQKRTDIKKKFGIDLDTAFEFEVDEEDEGGSE